MTSTRAPSELSLRRMIVHQLALNTTWPIKQTAQPVIHLATGETNASIVTSSYIWHSDSTNPQFGPKYSALTARSGPQAPLLGHELATSPRPIREGFTLITFGRPVRAIVPPKIRWTVQLPGVPASSPIYLLNLRPVRISGKMLLHPGLYLLPSGKPSYHDRPSLILLRAITL